MVVKRLAFNFSLVFFCFAALIFTFKSGVAQSLPTWVDSSTLELEKLRDLNTGELPPFSINGNRDCIEQKVITRPFKLAPPQSEQSHASCIVNTSYGAYSMSGLLQRQGTDVAGELRFTNSGGLISLIPVPHSNTSIRFGATGANGVNFYFTNNYGPVLQSSTDSFGVISHKAPPEYTSALKDKSGQLLFAQPDSISFSGNGKWMVVDVSFIGTVRVNLETFEVLPFGPSYNYNIGLAPSIQSAISSDGRYAVLFSKSFGRFRIYDLSSCAAVPNFITGPVGCQSRDLYSDMPGTDKHNVGVSTIRFTNNELLQLFINYKDGASSKTSQYLLGLPGASRFNMDYLALGDSYTSGEGAFGYKALTDTDDNKCHLSLISYPYLLGKKLNHNKYESVACSGAVSLDILGSKTYNEKERQSLGKENLGFDSEVYLGFLVGYRPQKDFVSKYVASVISVSAIGNDIGFSSKLRRCLEPDTCFAAYEDRVEIFREINGKFPKLLEIYQTLKSASPKSKLFVIGYPQIAATGGSCASNVHLNEEEIKFSQGLIAHLNNVVEQAASKVGAQYVDIEDALNGFRLCETQSWDVAVNGLTAGNDEIKVLGGPIGHESYHPTSFGHQLIAEKIDEETAGLTTTMPAADPNANPPVEDSNHPFLQAPKSGREIQKVNYDEDMWNNTMYRDGVWSGVITGVDIALKPFSIIKAELHSSPIVLGNFTADVQGNANINFTIPGSVPPGWHTIHIFGQNVANEPIDIYKAVYIAESQTDYNGNGISNEDDPCPTAVASGHDSDQDGADDACDGYIGRSMSENSTKNQTNLITPEAKANSSGLISPNLSQGTATTTNTLNTEDVTRVAGATEQKPASSQDAASQKGTASISAYWLFLLVIIPISFLSFKKFDSWG